MNFSCCMGGLGGWYHFRTQFGGEYAADGGEQQRVELLVQAEEVPEGQNHHLFGMILQPPVYLHQDGLSGKHNTPFISHSSQSRLYSVDVEQAQLSSGRTECWENVSHFWSTLLLLSKQLQHLDETYFMSFSPDMAHCFDCNVTNKVNFRAK